MGVVFIVAGGHAAVLFERAEEAFYHVAAGIALGLDARRSSASAAVAAVGQVASGYHGPNTASPQPAADMVGIIAAVGNELMRASTHLHLFAERLKLGAIMALTSGQMQGQGCARAVTDDM